MPHAVVDGLEPVEVEEQHPDHPIMSDGRSQGGVEPGPEFVPGQQAGELVVEGPMLHLPEVFVGLAGEPELKAERRRGRDRDRGPGRAHRDQRLHRVDQLPVDREHETHRDDQAEEHHEKDAQHQPPHEAAEAGSPIGESHGRWYRASDAPTWPPQPVSVRSAPRNRVARPRVPPRS